MLRRLSLRDFVIVPTLDIDFDAGFTVLTGETGAGKSILIDALQLALGSRADAAVVREGAPRAEICAEFEPHAALAAAFAPWLAEAGFDESDASSTVLLRRSVDAQGKSRAWINGRPATVTQLRELGEQLVDIHGQHAWQSLTRPEAVRQLLDTMAGLDTRALQSAWQACRNAQRALDAAREHHGELDRERERLSWQIGELEKLTPQPGEWGELNAEHTRLGHAQGILDAAQLALAAISEADESADVLTARALDALDAVAEFDPHLADAATVLRNAQAQLQDAAHSIQAALRHTELDPSRLAALDERLASWMSLARRFRKPPAELHDALQGWRSELQAIDAAADLAALEHAHMQARHAFEREARAASSARRVAAPRLAQAVSAAMQTLGMQGGRFEIALRPLDEPQSWGFEAIEFLVAGHAGSTPRPIGKVASGGELSRLALAIAVCARPETQPASEPGAPTLIFDEIDSGIGGAVADTVGRLLRRLGSEHQVLAVTHLPQVAACANQHFVVAKTALNDTTTSRITAVSGATRETEIARMLGGHTSAAGLAHAREMLAQTASASSPSP